MSKHEARHDAKAAAAAAPPDPDYAPAVAAARPKVRELLAEYRDDPTGDAGAIVEALMLNQVAGEPAREAEVLHFHQERDRHRALENNSGRTATRLARRNRQLQRQLVKQDVAQAYVRQYLEEVRAGVVKGKDPSSEEIIKKISTAMGISGPLIPRVETGACADAWNSRVASRERKVGG
jgi:hypothetical protein